MLTIDFVSDLMTRGVLGYPPMGHSGASPSGQEALTRLSLGPSPVPSLSWSLVLLLDTLDTIRLRAYI